MLFTFRNKEVINKEIKLLISTEVAKLGDGKSFGELALLHNKQRAASIITLEDTSFAVMNKKSFEKVMSDTKTREINQNIDFLDRFSYIKQLTKQSKTKLTYYAEKKNYVIGQEVFQEGEECASLYLIRSGEFEITKNVYITTRNQDPKKV